MLAQHSLNELERCDLCTEGKRKRLSPGDRVRHIDDPDSTGTIVARPYQSSNGVWVLWSRAPSSDPTRVTVARVRKHLSTTLKNYVSDRADKRTLFNTREDVSNVLRDTWRTHG